MRNIGNPETEVRSLYIERMHETDGAARACGYMVFG